MTTIDMSLPPVRTFYQWDPVVVVIWSVKGGFIAVIDVDDQEIDRSEVLPNVVACEQWASPMATMLLKQIGD